jgi:hypothetical protein
VKENALLREFKSVIDWCEGEGALSDVELKVVSKWSRIYAFLDRSKFDGNRSRIGSCVPSLAHS